MTKNEFMTILMKRLKERDVADIDDIVMEYEQHFSFKLRDGYSEAEIAKKLGDPSMLADQYDTSEEKTASGAGRRVMTVLGLAFADIFVGAFFLILYAFGALLGAFSIACAVIGICLFGGISPFGLIPYLPYGCAVIFAVVFLSLTVLSAVGTFYWFVFVRQLARAYGRYHKNCIASASGKAVLPSLAVHVQLAPRLRRRLRRAAMLSLCVFAVSLIAGYLVCAFAAGAVEWWHVWNWFVQ